MNRHVMGAILFAILAWFMLLIGAIGWIYSHDLHLVATAVGLALVFIGGAVAEVRIQHSKKLEAV